VQGVSGQVGAQGNTTAGVSGATGASGVAGQPGQVGPTGRQGPVGVVDRWTSYKDFTFEANKSDIQASQSDQVTQIAVYMKNNPSLKCGIDATDPRNQDLSNHRVKAIRESLIQAGVPAEKITSGAYGDIQLRRDGRVEVLICTGN